MMSTKITTIGQLEKRQKDLKSAPRFCREALEAHVELLKDDLERPVVFGNASFGAIVKDESGLESGVRELIMDYSRLLQCWPEVVLSARIICRDVA